MVSFICRIFLRKSFEEDEKSDESSDEEDAGTVEAVDSLNETSSFAERAAKSATLSTASSGRHKTGNMSANEKRLMEEKNNSIVAHFFLAIVWSIGGVLKQTSREKFDQFFNELCDNSIGKHLKLELELETQKITLEDNDSIF